MVSYWIELYQSLSWCFWSELTFSFVTSIWKVCCFLHKWSKQFLAGVMIWMLVLQGNNVVVKRRLQKAMWRRNTLASLQLKAQIHLAQHLIFIWQIIVRAIPQLGKVFLMSSIYTMQSFLSYSRTYNTSCSTFLCLSRMSTRLEAQFIYQSFSTTTLMPVGECCSFCLLVRSVLGV